MNNAYIRKLGFLAAALMSAVAVLLGAGCGKKNAVKDHG